jgi:ATP-dependent helicase/nuclease subunit B
MLNIYYGRENLNKEAFAFGEIAKKLKACDREILVIVPDQYKLETERQAIRYMDMPGLMGVEITGIRRIGNKILQEYGTGGRDYIDRYGRHIILSDIMSRIGGELRVYGRQGHRTAFLELVNNQISEFKRFGVTPQGLSDIISGLDKGGTLLKSKLTDIARIYEEYEKRIAGSYIDTEDRTDIFIKHLAESSEIKGKEIWISGFDWFAPKDLCVMDELIKIAPEMNIIFTYDDARADKPLFTITGDMISKFRGMADAAGVKYCLTQIGDEWLKESNPALAGLERDIFAVPIPQPDEKVKEAAKKSVKLVAAPSFHAEAEASAAYIMSLVRDEGYRYRDIALICNDQEERSEIVRQVYSEYGISLFVDTRRSILRHPAVGFLISLIDVVTCGYRAEDVFAMLKTGYGPITADETERLENYALCYKINGTRWKKEFTKAGSAKEREELEGLEELRKKVYDFTSSFEEIYKKDRGADSRTEAIYTFLRERVELPEKLQVEIRELEGEGKLEEAAELAQIWKSMLEVMAQLKTVMGTAKVSLESYRNLLSAGLSAVEVGILPPSADGITMDTMQRSRLGDIRALVILGANEGVLPKGGAAPGLLSDTDKQLLEAGAGKLAEIRLKEERIAMYRVLSQPKERLYMSFSSASATGEKLRSAEIFNDIAKYYDIKPEAGTATGTKDDLAGIETPQASLRHLAEETLRAARAGEKLDPKWREVYSWCRENSPEETKAFMSGLAYRHDRAKIDPKTAYDIYKKEEGDIRISPSTFENYSHCPFRFFVSSGLSPEERRVYEMANREIGDIYHECLDRIMTELSADGADVCDPASRWQTYTAEQIRSLSGRIFDEVARGYRGGLTSEGPLESYITSRMKEVLTENALALICQVRQGEVKSVKLEQSFSGRAGSPYPSVIIETDSGRKVRVIGKIDRVDELKGGEIKIIDYKSGNYTISEEEIRAGWKIQLMLYLKAAGRGAKPAGVFYYTIRTNLSGKKHGSEESLEAIRNSLKDEVESFNIRYRDQYAMEGLIVDDDEVLRGVMGEQSSQMKVLNGCKWTKSAGAFSGKALKTKEEFDDMAEEFDNMIKRLCERLTEGDVEARPKKQKKSGSGEPKTGCEYCDYRSICKFDRKLPGCEFETVDF